MAKTTDLLQGTLDLLFFARWGCGQSTVSRVEYSWSALGLENGRRVKFYELTASGRAQLAKEKRHWQKVQTAVNQVLTAET
jgi:hypothetical protein